jgi:hypothetical protein
LSAVVLPIGTPLLKVSAQLNSAPAALGSVPQLAAVTLAPAVTAVATTPAGS